MSEALEGRVLVPGAASGAVLKLDGPLSMWGGLDPESGEIIDRRHPQSGLVVSDRVVAMPFGRGSSSSSAVLLEAVRLGTAPAAFLLLEVDPILSLGATVARELYHRGPPVLVLDESDYDQLATGARVALDAAGRVTLGGRSSPPSAGGPARRPI